MHSTTVWSTQVAVTDVSLVVTISVVDMDAPVVLDKDLVLLITDHGRRTS